MSDERILVVEDDAVNREFLAHFLGSHGFVVEAFETGEEGLGAMREREFRLLILDLMLPGINGGQLAWAARESGFASPILAVSGAMDVWDPSDLHDLGVTAVLPKPFANDDLLRRVRDLVATTHGSTST